MKGDIIMNIEKLVNDIQQSIETKSISKETEQFLIHWLSNEKKTNDDREVFIKLALKQTLPFDGTNLFRGCQTLVNGSMESYSISIIEAARFATENGYIIAVDTSRSCFYTFYISEYLNILLGDIVNGEKENLFSEDLVDIYETFCGEDEVLVITDLNCSVVVKVDSIGTDL
jgi:hypothetical protein